MNTAATDITTEVLRRPATLPPSLRSPETLPPSLRSPETLPPSLRSPETLPPSLRSPQTLPPSLRSPQTHGGVRLLCIDGPAGSGKTTLAAQVAEQHPSAVVVHMDDVFEGWDGLADAPRRVREHIVDPLRRGATAAFRRYDWDRAELAETITVPVTDLLVIEGVAAGDPSYADAITLLVYVTAPIETRLRRGLDRDGEPMRPQWLCWQEQEAAYLRHARTEDRADLVIGT